MKSESKEQPIKKGGRGGVRAGAGRKPIDGEKDMSKTISFRVTDETYESYLRLKEAGVCIRKELSEYIKARSGEI